MAWPRILPRELIASVLVPDVPMSMPRKTLIAVIRLRKFKRGSLAALLVLMIGGCTGQPHESQPQPTSPPPSVAMSVLVVNEPELAQAIERLRGEWESRSGGTLSVTEQPWADVAKSPSLDADLIIFPTRYM